MKFERYIFSALDAYTGLVKVMFPDGIIPPKVYGQTLCSACKHKKKKRK